MTEMAVTDANQWTLVIRKLDLLKYTGTIQCAVCPKCGAIALYVENLTQLQEALRDI